MRGWINDSALGQILFQRQPDFVLCLIPELRFCSKLPDNGSGNLIALCERIIPVAAVGDVHRSSFIFLRVLNDDFNRQPVSAGGCTGASLCDQLFKDQLDVPAELRRNIILLAELIDLRDAAREVVVCRCNLKTELPQPLDERRERRPV